MQVVEGPPRDEPDGMGRHTRPRADGARQ
jgi:hypothetical protein